MRECPCPVWLIRPEHRGRPFGRVLAAVDPAPAPAPDDVLNLRPEPDAEAHRALNALILDLAGRVAVAEGAALLVAHAWHVPGEDLLRSEPRVEPAEVDAYVDGIEAEARRALDALLARHPAGPVAAEPVLVKGQPADAIADLARGRGVDLVVLGTVARSGLSGLLLGNTAESLLQRLDVSVLAVKPPGFVSPSAPRES